MPFPQILGDIGALATKGMRIPRVGAKTPPMLPPGLKQPSGAGMSGPLPEPTLSSGSPRPDQPDQPDENTGSGGILPMPQSLKQPPMTPGMQQLSDLYKQGAPPPATGVRGKIGGVFNALGWNWAGNPLKYPGLDVYQGQLARAQGLSNVEDEALKRQEAQQRIAESTENMRAMRDYRQNVALERAKGTYGQEMENVQKAGGFEAPSVPPSTDRVEMPPNPLTSIPAGSGMQGPDESDVVRNLPQRNLIFSPGLQPEQSSSLGTVQKLTDPNSNTTRSMVTPTKAVQREMNSEDLPPEVDKWVAKTYGEKPGQSYDKTRAKYYTEEFSKANQIAPTKSLSVDVAERTKVANQLGLKGGERTRYIATGQMADPEVAASRDLSRSATELLIEERRQKLDEIKAARGPAAIQQAADLVDKDPAAYFNLDKAIQSQVKTELTRRGSRVPIQKPNTDVEKQAANGMVAIAHVNNARQLLADPWIQQNVVGPAEGRIAKGEQLIGMNVPGATPEQTQKAQQFLSSLNYLFFREGRALFGGRPPERLMEELKQTSPSPQMAPARMKGALDATEKSAQMAIQANKDWMYGGPAASSATQSNPNPNGYVAGHVYGGMTYVGGDPNNQASWKK